jgi:hypothetical protein
LTETPVAAGRCRTDVRRRPKPLDRATAPQESQHSKRSTARPFRWAPIDGGVLRPQRECRRGPADDFPNFSDKEGRSRPFRLSFRRSDRGRITLDDEEIASLALFFSTVKQP